VETQFANSPDNVRIAYDRSGGGPAIVLIHGGGSRRLDWHEEGYVRRLQEYFTVITLDLRGHGESDLPTDPTDYTTEKMKKDILAVADACEVEHFIIWGMSYGGKIGRYLASQSERVTKIILMGTPMGPGASGELRHEIENSCTRWPPILQAQRDGTLDLGSLSEADREFLLHFKVPVILAWGRAMLDWPSVEPADFICPALWLVGSEDQQAMDSAREYEQSLKGSRVQLHILEGLNHLQVFENIDRALPAMLAFNQS
jgi:pimeloyl-ACP methyl ester carboxylesterase